MNNFGLHADSNPQHSKFTVVLPFTPGIVHILLGINTYNNSLLTLKPQKKSYNTHKKPSSNSTFFEEKPNKKINLLINKNIF